jgi:membrane fusion protein (multidrug efflux system)
MDIVKVPLEAVTEREGGKIVFLALNGNAKAQPVTLGISDGVYVEVISGVNTGENVIVEGNLGLEDGDRIVLKASRKSK